MLQKGPEGSVQLTSGGVLDSARRKADVGFQVAYLIPWLIALCVVGAVFSLVSFRPGFLRATAARRARLLQAGPPRFHPAPPGQSPISYPPPPTGPPRFHPAPPGQSPISYPPPPTGGSPG